MCERADGEGHGGSASAPRTCVAVGIASSAVHRARCESDPSRPPAASDCRPGRAAAPRATHACTGTTHQHAPAARQRHEPCRVRTATCQRCSLTHGANIDVFCQESCGGGENTHRAGGRSCALRHASRGFLACSRSPPSAETQAGAEHVPPATAQLTQLTAVTSPLTLTVVPSPR